MKLIEILKGEDLCKFRKEAEVRLKGGRVKIDGVVVTENIDLDFTKATRVEDWLYDMQFSEFEWRCLMIFCTPPQPSGGMSGIDYVFDKTEKWEDPLVLMRLPFLHLVNDGKLGLLQIAKRDKFILS